MLEYVHDDVRYTLTRYGLDESTQRTTKEKLSVHAILNMRQMDYFKDVLLSKSFREKMWLIVKGNHAYDDILPWLRVNKCPHVYDIETAKTANEYGILRYSIHYRRRKFQCNCSSWACNYNYRYEGDWVEGKMHGQGR